MMKLDKERIRQQIVDWLNLLNTTETIPSDIIALNFGLFETETGYSIYLIGSKTYDGDNSDWACPPYDFEAENYYLNLDNSRDVDWKTFQNLVVENLTNCLANPNDSQTIFAKIPHITTGFDNGDLIVV